MRGRIKWHEVWNGNTRRVHDISWTRAGVWAWVHWRGTGTQISIYLTHSKTYFYFILKRHKTWTRQGVFTLRQNRFKYEVDISFTTNLYVLLSVNKPLCFVHTWRLRLCQRQHHHQSLTLHQLSCKCREWVQTHSLDQRLCCYWHNDKRWT